MASNQTHLQIHSDPTEMAKLQAMLLGWCGEAGLDELAAFKLTCAVVEALNNCIEHAYGGEPGNPIDLLWTRSPDAVAIEIRDQGRPMPVPPLAPSPLPASDAESGRGWHIIREWTDTVSYARENGGNVLILTRRLT